ncbi:dihydrofolate reductase [Talaromyces proteolyticus]|uniref:Dihydrofolate reductase n=1 Tax=Talaromyces proteolyticus TaxID=1131652 RepID=A0AAD4L022_9EURO|nr:dihydrofolate reductase [Talaromyces proteolyticus]KAH8703754.1 dihydrofolate reductase [Talaromyces proteolyticus]
MAPSTTSTERQPLKILMLHGYTQSGSLFRAKTGALAKALTKAFPLHTVSLSYPTGPLRLTPSDVPGYTPSWNDPVAEANEIEAYGWWRRSNTANPPEYVGINNGLATVAKTLREEGPFDGVIGFSQGATMAYMVASLLEEERKGAFDHFAALGSASNGNSSCNGEDGGITGIPFPEEFAPENTGNHPPFKFAILYSGFRAPGSRYRGFYENPQLRTPALHVLGTLDAVVDEQRGRELMAACAGDPEKDGRVVFHPGGHFVPSQKTYLDAAVVFVRRSLEGGNKKDGEEERVEDMDMPF